MSTELLLHAAVARRSHDGSMDQPCVTTVRLFRSPLIYITKLSSTGCLDQHGPPQSHLMNRS